MAAGSSLRRATAALLASGPQGLQQAKSSLLIRPLTTCWGMQQVRLFGSEAEPAAGTSSNAAAGESSVPSLDATGRPGGTVNAQEAAKFAALAGQWWDPKGPFAPLHGMNPVRCRFLRAALCDAFGRDSAQPRPLAGLCLLDVGCGGGLLAEPLARMGAHVTGIDVNEGGIGTAQAHAARDAELAGRLQYRAATAEQLAAEGAAFDAVIASEVIEHVASLPAFCSALGVLTRSGGGIAISTLNRTPRSYVAAILGAEHLLRWVPPGTHDWAHFVTPEELEMQMAESGSGLRLLAGMQFNPLTGGWSLGRDTAVNYIAFFVKPEEAQAAQGAVQDEQEAQRPVATEGATAGPTAASGAAQPRVPA